jgi:toxin YoeB
MNPSNGDSWRAYFTPAAKIDAKKLSRSHLKDKVEHLLNVIREDPFKQPPPFEQLIGDLKGAYSRRVNVQYRLVYQVLTETRSIKILRMWSHYE